MRKALLRSRSIWVLETPDGIVATMILKSVTDKYGVKANTLYSAYINKRKTVGPIKILKRYNKPAPTHFSKY